MKGLGLPFSLETQRGDGRQLSAGDDEAEVFEPSPGYPEKAERTGEPLVQDDEPEERGAEEIKIEATGAGASSDVAAIEPEDASEHEKLPRRRSKWAAIGVGAAQLRGARAEEEPERPDDRDELEPELGSAFAGPLLIQGL